MIGNLDEGLPIFSKNIARSFDSAMFVYGIQNRFLRGIKFQIQKRLDTRNCVSRHSTVYAIQKSFF